MGLGVQGMIKQKILSVLESTDLILIGTSQMHRKENLTLGVIELLSGTTRLVSGGSLIPLWSSKFLTKVTQRVFIKMFEEPLEGEDNNLPFTLP